MFLPATDRHRAQQAQAALDSYAPYEIYLPKGDRFPDLKPDEGESKNQRRMVLSPLFVVRTAGVVWPDLLRRAAFVKRVKRFLGLSTLAVVRLQREKETTG